MMQGNCTGYICLSKRQLSLLNGDYNNYCLRRFITTGVKATSQMMTRQAHVSSRLLLIREQHTSICCEELNWASEVVSWGVLAGEQWQWPFRDSYQACGFVLSHSLPWTTQPEKAGWARLLVTSLGQFTQENREGTGLGGKRTLIRRGQYFPRDTALLVTCNT